ncbi:MAG: phosphoenolpyruvate carboxylase [Gammaproteobacteria bacterium]|nr:phosphoenolpyruvate carboxylase [Gammaproteobacteria bacterium]
MNRTEIQFPPKHAALREDVHLLGSLVGEVLRDQGGDALFEVVETDRQLAIARRNGDLDAASELEQRTRGRSPEMARELERAFTAWFQVVNLAEQVHRVRRRRAYFQDDRHRPQPGGVSAAIGALKEKGLDRDALMALLRSLQVVPVFMSHPTESTRRTILRKQQRLADLLFDRLNPTLSPSEQRASVAEIRSELTTSWQTGDHPRQQLTVADEREHVMFYLAEVLYRIVPDFYEEIAEAIGQHYGSSPDPIDIPVLIRFASWVGGDMDGNPDVHGKTIRETLARQQQGIVNAYFLEVQELAQVLSQSGSRVTVSEAVRQRTAEYALLMPDVRSSAPARHDSMPYRVFLLQVAERLRATYESRSTGYENPQQFARDISLVAESLLSNKGLYAGLHAVRRLQRRVDTFGFHLATLDVRQHSLIHHGVISRAMDRPDWLLLTAADRHAQLVSWLEQDVGPKADLDALGKRTLAVFATLLQSRRRYGDASVGAYVVNGVTSADDMLAPVLLARWADAVNKDTDLVAIDFAPMFDSMQALEAAGSSLSRLLAEPLYRRHLDGRGQRQWVWVGYSESSKQAGIVASRFAAYRAQGDIVKALHAAGEKQLLCHARGGSIPRGGGRVDAMLNGMPASAINGWLALTEQGEGINHHYGLGSIALRTLERAFGSLSLATASVGAPEGDVPSDNDWLPIAECMAVAGARVYRELIIESPGFEAWFRAVTPIDVIERMQIGNRPTTRHGHSGLMAIRAVPWVFAWTQNRMLLPGWFGAGTALQAALQQFGLEACRAAWRKPFLSHLFDDLSVMLSRTDLAISAHYLPLASHQIKESNQFFEMISREHELACTSLLKITGHADLLEEEPMQQRALQLRNPYVDPMHLMQVDLLSRWRAGGRDNRDLLDALLASINGISQGLQSTG